MVVSTLVYNASTGSDTAASGAGPASAVTGTSATNGTGNVVNLDGSPDLSGVAVDDILWANVSSGSRHLSRITAVDDGADTVTTEDLFSLGGGVSWAIGGKRQTLDNDTSRPDFEDGKAGWHFELEAGTYTVATSSDPEITMTCGAGTAADGPCVIKAASGASPTISWSSNVHLFDLATGMDVEFRDLTISNTTSTSLGARMFEGNNEFCGLTVKRCTLQSYGPILQCGDGRYGFYDCDIRSTQGTLINFLSTRLQAIFHKCVFRDSVNGTGISVNASCQQGGLVVNSCIFDDLGADGIAINGGVKHFLFHIVNNVFYSGGGDGVDILATFNVDSGPINIQNNIFVNNTGYGVNSGTNITGGMKEVCEDYNAFYNNTAGETNNITQGGNDVTLTGDPFTNAASDDFTLDDVSGEGAACKDAGFGYG